MERRNRIRGLVGLSVFIAIILLPFNATAAQEKKGLPKRISFASHRVGTSNNAITTALCKVATENSGILVVAKPGSGAAAWIHPMNKTGKPELGFAHILDVWWGYSGKLSPTPLPGNPFGTKPFYSKSPNLRVLIAGPRLSVGTITKADAPFKTLRQAKGKRLAGGFVAHIGAYATLVAMLANQDLTEKDFKVITVAHPKAGINGIIEGRVDVAIASVGMPFVTEANAKIGVVFQHLSEDPQDVKRLKEYFPGGTVKVRKPGPPGLKVPTPLLTYPLMVATSTHLSNEVAYVLVKAWWENYKDTWSLHPACKGWTSDDFVAKNTTVPYHPGAIRFFKEKGAWNPEMDNIQERLLKGEYPFLD